MTRPADGCVIDLDGTVYFAGEAIEGAAEALAAMRGAGVPICFATNTTRRPRSALVEHLADMAIKVKDDELFTAPRAAAGWLAGVGAQRLSLLLAESTFEEFAGFTLDDETPDAVVVGDLAEGWTFEVLNRAFRAVLGGARLVAIQRNRSWDAGDGLQLDAGPFVAALEYAADVEAVLVGKPSVPFFATAAAALGVDRARVAVVGDGIETDVAGAHAAGCLGVAVQTGTFREDSLSTLEQPPDAILGSIADLPAWLGI